MLLYYNMYNNIIILFVSQKHSPVIIFAIPRESIILHCSVFKYKELIQTYIVYINSVYNIRNVYNKPLFFLVSFVY